MNDPDQSKGRMPTRAIATSYRLHDRAAWKTKHCVKDPMIVELIDIVPFLRGSQVHLTPALEMTRQLGGGKDGKV